MSAPTDRNRLEDAESPYLRQHADNPVNWQPWDEAALEAARQRDVPIFLSVGYSACHWCHVMEEESFEDEGVAELLNEEFVPIKVDREERPDLDSIYQTVCQLVSGRGGWPLSVWLTPEGEPFYVGTYFPKEPKRGQPGFRELLERIADSWGDPEDRKEMEKRAREWTQAAVGELEETPDPIDPPESEVLVDAGEAALRAADSEYGGFGSSGPKFPQPGRLHVLLRAWDRTGRDVYREAVVDALDAMADGGIGDQVGGGFHRYATDRQWVVPHFEKMLYDNAEIPRVYLEGYRATGNERYAEVARETFAFVERELTHPDGGFFSTLDAQSDLPTGRDVGEREGAFYVWTPDEAAAAIDDDLERQLFVDRYGITPGGNFEGTTVLTRAASIAELADEHDLSEDDVRERLAAADRQVREHRESRPRPRRDEKVLAGWNGLMIAALADGALALDEDRWLELAEDALGFVRDELWNPAAATLYRRYKDGDVAIEGYLEDYAFLARGAFELYGATGDVEYLAFALDLARTIEGEFWDADAGTVYFTPESGESLVARPQELRDQSTPSSLGVAVDLLLALSAFVPHDRFEEIAEATLSTHGGRLTGRPLEHPSLVLAADHYDAGALEVTVAADETPAEWRRRLGRAFLPGMVLAPRPATDGELAEWVDRLVLPEAGPVWADREARDGATLYVCRSFTCSPPQTDVESALEWAEDLAPDA
jgi:uncharacterized protein YyaL (SSP411 family)